MRIESTVDSALDTHVGTIRLHTGFLGWLLHGSAGVERVEVEGVFARVSLASEGERAEWVRLRAALSTRGGGGGDGGTHASRDISVNDVSMTVRDARGEIVILESASFSREAESTSMTAHRIQLGKEPYDAIAMRDVVVRFVNDDGRTLLDEVRVADADARWVAREGDSDRDENTMVRLLAAAHLLSSRTERGPIAVVSPPAEPSAARDRRPWG